MQVRTEWPQALLPYLFGLMSALYTGYMFGISPMLSFYYGLG